MLCTQYFQYTVCQNFEASYFDYVNNILEFNMSCNSMNALKCNHTSGLFELMRTSECIMGELFQCMNNLEFCIDVVTS